MTLEFQQLGLAPDFINYTRGWEIQRELHAKVLAGTAPSTVLLLEHAAVYTAGKRTEDHERPFDGTPVVPVDRGGKLTWHGPGQLVGYPIIKLKNPAGIRDYVERLESVMIAVLADYGIDAVRIEGRAGVWIDADEKGPARKIAAIGIRVHEGVTMHGFAINCNNDLPRTARSSPAASPTPASRRSPRKPAGTSPPQTSCRGSSKNCARMKKPSSLPMKEPCCDPGTRRTQAAAY